MGIQSRKGTKEEVGYASLLEFISFSTFCAAVDINKSLCLDFVMSSFLHGTYIGPSPSILALTGGREGLGMKLKLNSMSVDNCLTLSTLVFIHTA